MSCFFSDLRKKFDKLSTEFANEQHHDNSDHGNYDDIRVSLTVGK